MPSDKIAAVTATETVPRQGSRDLLDVLTEEFRELRPGASCPAGTLVELYGAIHQLEQEDLLHRAFG